MNISVNESHSSNDIILSGKLPKTLAYSFLVLMSIMGNSFLVWAFRRDNRLKTTTNVLIANMAVSDLFSSVFASLPRVYEVLYNGVWMWTGDFGIALCKIANFIPGVFVCVSIYSCVFISIDRYYAVAHPLKGGFSSSRLKYIITLIWIIAVVSASQYFYIMDIIILYGKTFCVIQYDSSYASFGYLFFSLFYGLPLLIISVTYTLIVYKIRQHKVPGQQTDSVRRRRNEQNRKVFKMSAVIVGLFYFSFLWIGIVAALLAKREYSSQLLFVAPFLFYMSSCYNFVICLIFNDTYRQNCKAILSLCSSVS